ncbi:hypothetical protein EIP91_008065 [Steccherinum ochraceum]|uniref:Uncharacterized protein n=1 Tax=Steccherinum ochraceum TaxID=92696 RepID=A0A4R0RKS4_9APHY|nr:hypothetical protein EIP91_008065 [Steccherinum ochraceum]
MAKAKTSKPPVVRGKRPKSTSKTKNTRTKAVSTKARTQKDELPRIPASHRFPFELAMYTIEHLRGHKEGILACSLTCKGWYSFARKLVYDTLAIGNAARYSAVKQLLQANEDVRLWIRKIEIGPDWVSRERVQFLAKTLPKVRILKFHGPQLQWTDSLLSFTGVSEVVLQDCYIADKTLLALSGAFPLLSSLLVLGGEIISGYVGPRYRDEEPSPLLKIPRELRLENLVVSSRHNMVPAYYHWENYMGDRLIFSLMESAQLRSLRSLTIHMQEGIRPCPGEVGRLLDSLSGSGLEELSLMFPRAAFWDSYKRHLNIAVPIRLSTLTKLRSLTLSSPLHPAVLQLLEVPLPSLRQLKLEIEFHSERGARTRLDKYEPLDQRLCHSDWAYLDDVCINYTGELLEEVVRDILRLSLPGSTRKDALRVTMNEDEGLRVMASSSTSKRRANSAVVLLRHGKNKSDSRKDGQVASHTPASHRFPLDLVISTIEYLRGDNGTIRALGRKEEVRPLIREIIAGDYSYSQLHIASGSLKERLTNVHTLRFRGPALLASFQLFTSFINVRELEFQQLTIPDIHLATIIRHLPHLASLILLNGEVNNSYYHPPDTPLQFSERLELDNLVISPRVPKPTTGGNYYWSRIEGERFIPSLIQSNALRSLRSLVIHMQENTHPSPGTVGRLLDSLRACDSILEELSLMFPRSGYFAAYVKKYNPQHRIRVSGLTKLRSLALGNPGHCAVLPILEEILPSVRRVSFEIEFYRAENVLCRRYRPLDERLCHPDWHGLEGVHINYVGGVYKERATKRLERAFPQLSEKGLLRITMNKDNVKIHIPSHVPRYS